MFSQVSGESFHQKGRYPK